MGSLLSFHKNVSYEGRITLCLHVQVSSLKQLNTCPSYTAVIYRVSQEECARLREGVPYVKVYRYNPKHLYPKLKSYGDNGQRSLKL